jgi:hypothetical protein
VAVGAQNAQVLQPVVVSPTIDVIQLKGNGILIPLASPTSLALRLLHSLPDEPLLQPVGLNEPAFHKELGQWLGRDDRIGAASSPRLTDKVRCIEAQPRDPFLECHLTTAAGLKTELPEYLGQGSRGPYGISHLFIGAGESWALAEGAEVRCVEAKLRDPLPNVLVISSIGDEAELDEDVSHPLACSYGTCQLQIVVLLRTTSHLRDHNQGV